MSSRPLRPLGVMILALLRERDMHPYEMIRLFRERREDRLVSLQSGTFYNQIAGLERDGLIAEVSVDRDGNRPERTTYTLLPTGMQLVAAWVREHLGRTDRPDEFRVALAESHNLDRAEVLTQLRGRAAALEALRDDFAENLADALERGVGRQFLVELQRAIAMMTADISFTAALCADLADDSFVWGIPPRPMEPRKDDA